MKSYRLFAGITAGVSVLVLLLTQVVGGPEESAVPPDMEPLPAPTLTPIEAPTLEPNEEPTEDSTQGPDQDPSVDPTTAATAEPSLPPASPPIELPPPELGAVVYDHDFSSPEGGLLSGEPYTTGSNEFGSRIARYSRAETLLVTSRSSIDTFVAGANTQDMVVDGNDLSDLAEVSVEVDAIPKGIGEAASWGLACRRDREVGRFYYAFVADLGGRTEAGIIRQDEPGGQWAELGRVDVPAGVDIGRGTSNRLRLDCLGSTLTLFVDGIETVRATDSTYSSGAVALFVNPIPSEGEAAARVAFDNMLIREA